MAAVSLGPGQGHSQLFSRPIGHRARRACHRVVALLIIPLILYSIYVTSHARIKLDSVCEFMSEKNSAINYIQQLHRTSWLSVFVCGKEELFH